MIKRLLIVLLILQMLIIPVSALVVTIDLAWGLSPNYNVQEGSIVQVVAYRTGQGSNPQPGADNNFDVTGDYLGESTYDAYNTPFNHNIVYETTVNANLNNYFVLEQFELLANYNRIYIRIFSETSLPENGVRLSYWGMTPLNIIPQNGRPVTVYYNNFNRVTNENYFGTAQYFEVIPEVPTGNLIALGILSFVIWKICLRK